MTDDHFIGQKNVLRFKLPGNVLPVSRTTNMPIDTQEQLYCTPRFLCSYKTHECFKEVHKKYTPEKYRTQMCVLLRKRERIGAWYKAVLKTNQQNKTEMHQVDSICFKTPNRIIGLRPGKCMKVVHRASRRDS